MNSINKKEDLYISHSWGITDSIVSEIVKTLKKDFNVIIDKKDLSYKDNIKEFEERLGKGEKIILVICDKYLRSKHCMYEVLKIKENGNVYSRIFPIVMKNAGIYDAYSTTNYIKHWEDEIEKIDTNLKGLKSFANTREITTDLDNYTKFRAIFDDFRGLLAKMNTLSPEIHQETNFRDLLKVLKGDKPKEHSKPQKEFANRISQTKSLFEKSISLINEEINIHGSKADEILEKIQYFYDQCKNQSFQIAVMAMVKSGKSTFINSMLGDEFLPMSNVPETSISIQISHSNNRNGLLKNGTDSIEGVENIKNFIAKKNKERRDEGQIEEIVYKLYAPFKALQEKQMDEISFEIIDTPGFGEALKTGIVGKSINQSNDDMINKISAIIYLLDYSKLKTQAENEVIEKLSLMRGDLLEKIQDRLFFVINQTDKKDRNSLPPEDAIEYVYELVKAQIPNLSKENIFHSSARNALLSRLILDEKATDEAKNDFGEIAFGLGASSMTLELFKSSAKKILEVSQIAEIENKIINYIYDNRSRIFIEGLLDNLKRLLVDFKNKFIITAEGTLSKTIVEIEDLEQKIEIAKKKQESIQDDANKFEKEIKDWIEKKFKFFETTINENIDSIFNPEKAIEKQTFFLNMTPQFEWVKNVQNLIRDAELSQSYTPKETTEQRVREINQKMKFELSNSFQEFKKELEQKIISKQDILFKNLGQIINSLAREFEATLKKSLNINLEAVEIQLNSSVVDNLLTDSELLLNRFVTSQYKSEDVLREHKVYNPGSWCENGRYETYNRVEQEIRIENSINKNFIEIYWKKKIEEMNSNAKNIADTLIEKSIKKQIVNARNSFNSYITDYMTTIQEQKIKLSTNSKEEIEERMNILRKLNDNVTSIIQQLD